MIVILGPTATGKTTIATTLAAEIDGEILSADSRQVYRGMDIGTGKDLADYSYNGTTIPYHLIDIANPGEEYHLFNYQTDFFKAYQQILERDKTPILCGGTGLYLEAILGEYNLKEVPRNEKLRQELENSSNAELVEYLSSLRKLHNGTDSEERERIIRAIEIEVYKKENPDDSSGDFPKIQSSVFGINYDRAVVRKRITTRLKERLETGMVEEVQTLLGNGVSAERLKMYGLEYRYLTEYLLNERTYDEMFRLLNTAIHQFSKRQMTWFRRMEKRGIEIDWIPEQLSVEEKVSYIINQIKGEK